MARVLVVDDDALVRNAVQAMLTSGGHEVALAVDGEDGLQQFAREPFDLVLCDVIMPNMDGLDARNQVQTRLLHDHLARSVSDPASPL
jgi:CheY-like chemotaxis protein